MRIPGEAARPLTWLGVQIVATIVLLLVLLSIMAVARVIIPPLLVFALVFAATAYALRRWGPTRSWVRVVGAVLALLAVLANIGPILQDLAHPESALVFVPSALGLLTAITAAAAGVAGFFRAFEEIVRSAGLAALGVGALLVVVSGVAALRLESDDSQMGDVRIVAHRVQYPDTVLAKVGQVALFIENRDGFRHTFTIEQRGVDVELPASTDRRVVLELPVGRYPFICTVFGHEQMEGVLTVER